MGVKGLTGYVKLAQKAIAEEVTFHVPALRSSTPPNIGPLVIDGWAWIFRAYLDHLVDIVRGGDYTGYMLHVRQTVASFRACGLEPIFLFDGAYLPQKVSTVLARMGEKAASNSVFMRSTYRSKPSSQSAIGVPCLIYECTLEALRMCNIQVVISESEADSAVAEMAEHLSGWAVSNDSDFFILCSRGSKCRGYVPIDSIHYLVERSMSKSQSDTSDTSSVADDGFAPVRKSRKAQAQSRKVTAEQQSASYRPPVSSEDGELVGIQFMAYSSMKLAGHLGISPAMLPLLAALVGNDFTTATQRRVLSPALPSGPGKIELIARYIKEEGSRMTSPGGLTSSPQSGSATPSIGRARLGRSALVGTTGRSLSLARTASTSTSATATPTGTMLYPKLDEALAALALNDPVRYMVHKVIDRILANTTSSSSEHHVASGEKDDIVDSVIDSVCTYSLLTHASSLHLTSPAADFFKTSPSHEIIAKYQQKYLLGYFEPTLVEALTLKKSFTRIAPEDPDQKSVQVTHARDLRGWVFTILFASWGMNWARDTLEEPQIEAEEDSALDEGSSRAIPILAGPGPNRVDWAKEGDPDEMIPVQTPPSSFGSSLNISGDDDDDSDASDEAISRPGSAVGLLDDVEDEGQMKPPPAVIDYARKGERYTSDLCPIWSLDTLVQSHRDELGIEPPQALAKYLASAH